ncbi:DUF1223 domain-containing protein [Paracoccaceae bacterium Fryx2]|nr:DUF1223 domain-containing protein [Paracoccaceae bacterium Fryx2]
MRHIISAACGLWLALCGTAFAQSSEPVVVVELYTSQGCSSCPPADEYLETLIKNRQVIPLSLHVDYWDYIGWPDAFAQARFTDRQKAYARAAGSRTIYTPQLIVAGLDRVEGHRPAEVERLIAAHLGKAPRVRLWLERKGERLIIRAEAVPPLTHAARVQLVRYRPSQTVTIERGENAGRTVDYHNIVTSWQPLAQWAGTSPLEIETEAAGAEPVVVILQAEGPAEILAAARLD